MLLIVLAVECTAFSATGSNFLTAGNGFELTRLAVELGLLALALTPVILTGGIDLSVGSMMGLSWCWGAYGGTRICQCRLQSPRR